MSVYYDFQAIPNYTIGFGTLKELRRLTRGYGDKYLIIRDSKHFSETTQAKLESGLNAETDAEPLTGQNMLGRAVGLLDNIERDPEPLAAAQFEYLELTATTCSYENAKALGEQIKEHDPEIVVALGGGKCLDLARAALHFFPQYGRPVLVMCPDILSTNACANGMSVIYDEAGEQMVDFWNLEVMPEFVIVDTELILNSPVDSFVAGIGDQLASCVEALHTLEKTGEANVCIDLCIEHHEAVLRLLKKHAPGAIAAMKQGEATPEFEAVCHAVSYYTAQEFAVATSFFSHILDEALLEFPEVRRRMHGHVVGYGILPEMVAFGTPEEIPGYVRLYREIGIPCTLAELGVEDDSYEAVLAACRKASDKIMASRAIHQWTPEEMADAVMKADELVRQPG